jgi:hypothetical protein
MAWGFGIGVVLATGFWLLVFGAIPEAAEKLHQWIQRRIGG